MEDQNALVPQQTGLKRGEFKWRKQCNSSKEAAFQRECSQFFFDFPSTPSWVALRQGNAIIRYSGLVRKEHANTLLLRRGENGMGEGRSYSPPSLTCPLPFRITWISIHVADLQWKDFSVLQRR